MGLFPQDLELVSHLISSLSSHPTTPLLSSSFIIVIIINFTLYLSIYIYISTSYHLPSIHIYIYYAIYSSIDLSIYRRITTTLRTNERINKRRRDININQRFFPLLLTKQTQKKQPPKTLRIHKYVFASHRLLFLYIAVLVELLSFSHT